MSSDPHHRISEMPALYALGALTQHEARGFDEHLAEGCDGCRIEIEGFDAVVTDLAFASPEVAPPPGVREELLRVTAKGQTREAANVNRDAGRSLELVSIRARDRRWNQVSEGIMVERLFVDPISGLQTSLVKMAAGTRLPAHRHSGVEQFFILEGDCTVEGELLGPGDYHRAESGSVHQITRTEHGTMFLLVAPESWETISPQ